MKKLQSVDQKQTKTIYKIAEVHKIKIETQGLYKISKISHFDEQKFDSDILLNKH